MTPYDSAASPITHTVAPDPLADLPRDASPQAVLAAAFRAFPGKIALVSSFGTESAALLHMAAAIDPSVSVIFLDTGHLFPQTIDYRQDLARRLGLTDVRDRRPTFADLALRDPAADLWSSDPDACCGLRKVAPLASALEGFDAWITGRKRFQGAERARLPVVERDGALADYVKLHRLPAHPLRSGGYASVGCRPCTVESDDGRAGRWAGSGKTECGIHRPKPAPADLGGGV